MREIRYFICSLLTIFLITSSTIKSSDSKRLFEKIIYVEFSIDEDSVLFQPYSKAWRDRWSYSDDFNIHGTALMSYKKYKESFRDRKDNLYTILHPIIIEGAIQLYFSSDPETYGMGQSDDGELRYPILDMDKKETFLTSERVREDLCYQLGLFGPMSDIPLVDEYGDLVTVNNADGTQSYKYPPRDFYWYTDKDIVKYKLRVSVMLNNKGKEKKRIIKSLCPITNRYSEIGEIVGENELLWFNFEDLKPTLEEAYYFEENMKPITYLNYFKQKVKSARLNDKKEDKPSSN